MDRNQGSATRNVQSGCKFQNFFATVIVAADENGDREGQANPRASFYFVLSPMQTTLLRNAGWLDYRTFWAKQTKQKTAITSTWPSFAGRVGLLAGFLRRECFAHSLFACFSRLNGG